MTVADAHAHFFADDTKRSSLCVNRGALANRKVNAAQAVRDAGCAALLEDENKLSKQSIMQRKPCSSASNRRNAKKISAVTGGVLLKTMSRLYSTAEHQLRLAAVSAGSLLIV